MDNKLVTVGIPTRSVGPEIYTAIQSVLDQTYKNFEILIINDSGDPNNEKIKDIERNFEKLCNLRVIHHKKNLGIGSSRNSIIKYAKGDYICFLSSDDEFFPDYIEVMIIFANKYPESILYCNYCIMNSEGIVISEIRVPAFYDYNDFKSLVINCAINNGMFVCYNLFAPTNILKKYKFNPKYRFGEDYEHLLRCVLIENLIFTHVPKILFKYCARDNSTTGKKLRDIPENDAKIRSEINKMAGKNIF